MMGRFLFENYVALRTRTKGCHLGTYNRSIGESQKNKGLKSKLDPKESFEAEDGASARGLPKI